MMPDTVVVFARNHEQFPFQKNKLCYTWINLNDITLEGTRSEYYNKIFRHAYLNDIALYMGVLCCFPLLCRKDQMGRMWFILFKNRAGELCWKFSVQKNVIWCYNSKEKNKCAEHSDKGFKESALTVCEVLKGDFSEFERINQKLRVGGVVLLFSCLWCRGWNECYRTSFRNRVTLRICCWASFLSLPPSPCRSQYWLCGDGCGGECRCWSAEGFLCWPARSADPLQPAPRAGGGRK